MLKIKREGVILRPTDLEFENLSVFNPGIMQEGNTVHIIYRAINKDYTSTLGYAKSDGPMNITERWTKPFMSPRYKYEKKGIEDPRITKIGDTIYMAYIVHDGQNALIAYSSGKDLFSLKRGGIISPQLTYNKAGKLFGKSKLKDDYYTFKSYYKDYEGSDVEVWDKDGFFFPEKIKNEYVFMHRILPDIQIAPAKHVYLLKTKEYWERNISRLDKFIVLEPNFGWETRHVGGGCPPIKTEAGWLLIYHGVEHFNTGRIYHAGAALLDLKNPRKVIARLPKPLLSPEKGYEEKGHVNNVVFPTGTAQFDGRLYIYYGTADSDIAVASVDMQEFIAELLANKITDNID